MCQKQICPPKLGIYAICAKNITVYIDVAHIYMPHKKLLAPTTQQEPACTYFTLLNKYSCHISNKAHMANMLNWQINPTFLHMYATIKATATSSSHVIAKYVPHINIPNKLGICQIFDLYICGMYYHVCGIYEKCALKTLSCTNLHRHKHRKQTASSSTGWICQKKTYTVQCDSICYSIFI